jgi:hypothetical protein
VVRVAGTVAGIAALDLGSHTAGGTQSCSLKGLHVVWAGNGRIYAIVDQLLRK